MKTQTAVDYFGSQKKLAAKLGITQPAISHWGETVPLVRQYQLQVLTRGRLRAEDQPVSKKSGLK